MSTSRRIGPVMSNDSPWSSPFLLRPLPLASPPPRQQRKEGERDADGMRGIANWETAVRGERR